jgi:hypothetical protein
MRRILFSGAGLSTTLSLILAVALASATSTNTQIAVVIGLLSTLIGLTITAYVAIEEHLTRINEARIGALPLQRLLAIPDLEETLVRLVESTAETNSGHGPFLQSLARETIEDACERVANISDGVVRCAADDELRLVRRALEHTERRVIAVAARGTDWWSRPEADVYWRAYGQAAQRLDITRIFVIRDGTEHEMQQVLTRHHRLGMKTLTVRADEAPPDRIRALVVFDDALLHRHAPRRELEADGYHIEFTDRADDIVRAQETFNVLLDLAVEWHPSTDHAPAIAPAGLDRAKAPVPRGAVRRLRLWLGRLAGS